VLKELKRPEEALASYEQAIAFKADFVEAHANRGNVLKDLKRPEEALASYERAIALKADFAPAHYNRGTVLQQLKRREAALAGYERALELKGDFAEAHFNRGTVLQELERWDAALGSYDEAIGLKPDYVEALCYRGSVLQKLGRWQEAQAAISDALVLRPQYAEAHLNRGNLFKELKQSNEALASYERAIACDPGLAEAYHNRGVLQQELEQWRAALASYDRALALKPDLAEAYFNRAGLQCILSDFAGAIESYTRGLALDPNLQFVLGHLQLARMQLCDWGDFGVHLARLTAGLESGAAVSAPLPMQVVSDSAALQRRAAEIWTRATCPPNPALPPIAKRRRHDKLRIGYFSGDFRGHAVSYLTAGIFETHDRSRFEVLAFSFSADTQDEMRDRLKKGFDRFIDVRGMTDEEVVRLARSLEIDIAVDLGGFTLGGRQGIFALRAAPLQLGYLGYLGTIAAPYMDYLIADRSIVPESHREHYAEKIIYLQSYQANDSKREVVEESFTRGGLGLPADGFVFCCFNANYKITPATFDGWMRILRGVPGSVLFLYAGNETAERNLRREAQSRGVDAGRLVFDKWRPRREYLARFHVAELFLDTLPYNAGTTASDALWVGLPVLTCMGESFAGRVAGSVLRAIELPELIATSQEQYERMAVELAGDPDRLAAIRGKLARNRSHARLFDTVRMTRSLESAYDRICARYHDDLPPEHILPPPGPAIAGSTNL
jgi:predicted O-linked N-acetylglucosamine transferase (SPINDLY family)